MDSDRKTWRTIKQVSVVLGIIAALVTIIGGIATLEGSPHAAGQPGSANTQNGNTLRGTATATVVPQPTATSTPPPKPGTILYRADWTSGLNGWHGSPQWKTVNGMLVSDGSDNNTDLPASSVYPPFQPQTQNYAIQADIRIGACAGIYQGNQNCGTAGIGLVARETSEGSHGYVAGVDNVNSDAGPSFANIHMDETIGYDGQTLGQTTFTPGTGWHTYRFEVRGNLLTLFIDGGQVAQATDNTYLDPGAVGIESYFLQIEVRSFTVTAL